MAETAFYQNQAVDIVVWVTDRSGNNASANSATFSVRRADNTTGQWTGGQAGITYSATGFYRLELAGGVVTAMGGWAVDFVSETPDTVQVGAFNIKQRPVS